MSTSAFSLSSPESLTAQDWILLAMLTLLGGAIGSFINVVVYRMPAGISLVWPPSRCPRCGARIRWLDNIPVLGWLKLRGRCRDCREPISLRYPIVELLTAVVFFGLAWVEPISGARNLPDRLGFEPGHGAYALAWTYWQLWAVYAYHLLLLCVLECTMLKELDGFAISRRIIAPLGLVGLAAPLGCVQLHPVAAFQVVVERMAHQEVLLALVDGLAGLAVGLVMGMLASPLAQAGPARQPGVRTVLFASTSIGIFLGWQAVAILMMVTSVLDAAMLVYRPLWERLERVPFTGLLWIATIVWLVAWRPIVGLDFRMAGGASGWLLAASGGIVLLASLLGWMADRYRNRNRSAVQPQPPA